MSSDSDSEPEVVSNKQSKQSATQFLHSINQQNAKIQKLEKERRRRVNERNSAQKQKVPEITAEDFENFEKELIEEEEKNEKKMVIDINRRASKKPVVIGKIVDGFKVVPLSKIDEMQASKVNKDLLAWKEKKANRVKRIDTKRMVNVCTGRTVFSKI